MTKHYGTGAGAGITQAALAPQRFYQSVFIAQLVRYKQTRVPVWVRLQEMTGLNYLTHASHLDLALAALVLAAFVAAASVGAALITRRLPPPLEWFGVATAASPHSPPARMVTARSRCRSVGIRCSNQARILALRPCRPAQELGSDISPLSKDISISV